MKTDVSFIISIDSSFEMTNNFFEHLLQNEFALNSEIIVVLDSITNCYTIKYIKQLNKYENIKIYILDQKVGYGKANNYAVKQAQNNILYFIFIVFIKIKSNNSTISKFYYGLIIIYIRRHYCFSSFVHPNSIYIMVQYIFA